MTEHEDWLKLTAEDIIDPELPIIDSHHHIHANFLVEEFLKDIGDNGHNVTKTVFIEDWILYRDSPQGHEPWRETEWIVSETARVKSKTQVAAAIVGYADLAAGSEVAPVLEKHIAASQGRFRGIRFVIAFGGPPRVPGLLADPKFREGVAALNNCQGSYDTMVHYSQLPELVDLANAFPGMPIIVNHIGMPTGTGPSDPDREEVLEVWQKGIAALAPCPNLYIKLGGLTMPMFGFGWDKLPAPPGSEEMAGVMAPYYLHCIEQVGPQRCMFESNFHPDKRSTSYNLLWNTFKRVAASFSEAERRALFHDTAARVYRLQ